MAQHSIDLDLAAALAAPRRCPACESPDLLPVCDGRDTVFVCRTCSRSWVAELGGLAPTDPQSPATEALATPAPRSGRRR